MSVTEITSLQDQLSSKILELTILQQSFDEYIDSSKELEVKRRKYLKVGFCVKKQRLIY
jgi:hypothetical protein